MAHSHDGADPLPDRIDVLVVGAGPTGLTAGLALAAYEVDMLVVDACAEPRNLPRARLLDVRTVEVLRRLDAADEVVAAALRTQRRGAPFTFATDLARAEHRPTMVQHWFGSGRHSPMQSVVCPQDQVERVLRGLLPVGRLRHGVRVRGVRQDAGGANVLLSHPDGRLHRMRVRYVVGADGFESVIRRTAGIAMPGFETVARAKACAQMVSVLVEADLSGLTGDQVCNAYFLEPEGGPLAILHPTATPHRWTLNMIYRRRAEQDAALRDETDCERHVRSVLGDGAPALRVLERQGGPVASAVAETLVRGRVLLAGDAAHVLSPLSGAGMTLGVGDADNLAWKLAAVLEGTARPDLLATYETERHSVADRFVQEDRTNVAAALGGEPGWGAWRDMHADRLNKDGLVLGASYDEGAFVPEWSSEPAATPSYREYVPDAAPGHRAPHAEVQAGAGSRSVLDEFGPEAVLLTADHRWGDAADEASERTRVPLRVRVLPRTLPDADALGPSWVDVYGIGDHGAVLVRPDGYVGWRVDEPSSHACSPRRRVEVMTAALCRCWSASIA